MQIKSSSFVISNTEVVKCPKSNLAEYAFIGRSNVGKSSLINALCNKKNYDDVFVIGGEQIYKKFLDERLIDTVYITEIHNDYKCDTFFPKLPNDFYIYHATKTVWENDIGLRFTTWKKREVCDPGIIVTGLHAF